MSRKSKAKSLGLSRRQLFKTAAVGAGTVFLGNLLKLGRAAAGPLGMMAAAKSGEVKKLDPLAGLSVILLGTGTPLPNPDRACASTLVIAGDKAFLVDTGRGSLKRFADTGLRDVDGVFFTHYHSDHFGELAEFLVTRTIWGASKPMPVTGPAGAGQVISGLMSAYELDNQYRKAHHGDKWNAAGMKAEVKESGPGVVYENNGLKVTMFEVDHTPVKPAMAYKFEYKGQALVISGDTKKTAAMIEMAKNADLLVHEAVSRQMTEIGAKAGKAMDERMRQMAAEMLQYHTSTEELAEIARDAGVKKLVLTHLAPALPANAAMEAMFGAGMSGIFKGPIVVGRDGMEIKV